MFWADKRAKITGFQFRWLLVISAAVVLALGLVLLFLLTQATDNRQLYEQNYRQLFGLKVEVLSHYSEGLRRSASDAGTTILVT